MAAVTVRSVFGAQENKICHCLHFLSSHKVYYKGNTSDYN